MQTRPILKKPKSLSPHRHPLSLHKSLSMSRLHLATEVFVPPSSHYWYAFFFSFILFFTALCFSIRPCVSSCCNFLVWFNFHAHLMYEIYGGLARVGCSKMPI